MLDEDIDALESIYQVSDAVHGSLCWLILTLNILRRDSVVCPKAESRMMSCHLDVSNWTCCKYIPFVSLALSL
jgi:hypothetical protein